jgi:hypothetical protein
MTEHASRLRYVDADQLDSRVLDLDGLDVRNQHEDHIGDVEGLLIDSVSGRPRYLVIDSGGWFRSRQFLLPVAHARLDSDRRALRVDFDKDTINRFPEMRTDRYDSITDAELQRYDEGVWRASGLTDTSREDVRGTDYGTSPTWWNSTAWASTTPVTGAPSVSTGRPVIGEEVMARSDDQVRARAEHERMLAHERDTDRLAGADVSYTDTYRDRDRDGVRDDRDRVVAPDRDRDGTPDFRDPVVRRDRDDLRAPAVGERAQPGDILGIESAGETTSLGDTAEDEDKRRERAEKDIRDVTIEADPDLDKRRR